ncbi:MAG: hypothetical protein K9I95_14110 [Flavobacteriaceae bacterium]|nr:hypothetical protein [Flavobacteriaceae bacterium]
MTPFEQFQKELSKDKNKRRPIKFGERLNYVITKDRLNYLLDGYFRGLYFEEDYISYNYLEQDLPALLVIVRHHFKLWVEFDSSGNFLNVYKIFPKVFKVIKEVNKENHTFAQESFEPGSILYLAEDNYETVNWLNGIPLTRSLEKEEGINITPTIQINYGYIKSYSIDNLK